MSVITRINDVIQSNIIAMLDKAEDPQKLIKLLLNDMQGALSECRTTAATLLCEEKALKRHIKANVLTMNHWQEQVEIAIAKNRDDLAKAALMQKQVIADDVTIKESELAALQNSIVKMSDDCERLNKKIADAKVKQSQLEKRQNIATVKAKVHGQVHSEKITHAMSRFDCIEQRVESIEAQVEAYEMTSSASSMADEINNIVKNEAIDNELAALKMTIKKSA
ncbi:PspA/IM30 family protein [Pseudoalteromonas sp. MMG010]|uniref:PspA/IM30 family protein n=1 Tax=Pseudoalteromonas sp. MMG010 TaxID=2822685 RepID=UPI001B3A4291|nr:PspA/IM30 family protein [Pseudoalteromonas sp. MMG010]MBQ4832939.1 PspA/IM30 family protein [Pseudoalteromonas sp. MMG010]